MAYVIVGSARIDEHGQAHGGMAGDQTGGEVATQRWYLHTQGSWRVLRPKDRVKAEAIAQNMEAACANPHIGYDQYQRDTLYNEAKKVGFSCVRVEKDVETDCSALVRVCLAYAGIDVPNFRTYNERTVLMQSGAFLEMVGTKYQKHQEYLRRGDVLVTPSSGHTVVVLTNGSKAEETPQETVEEDFDEDMETIRQGSKGAQVRTLQRLLNAICGEKLDVDGEFGPATRTALVSYQITRKLEADGICGQMTWKKILKGE